MSALNEVAVVILAGGQGTRLGSSRPKGLFDIGVGKCLFQLMCERIRDAGELPLYIMTSSQTHDATVEAFKANNFFGLADVVFFQQADLPCTDLAGNALRNSDGHVIYLPNGNGGVFEALRRCGCLHDMRRRGVKYVNIHGVDNCLVRSGDPAFVKFLVESGAEQATKVVPKARWDEKVGVVAKVDGRYKVVEYSEISDEMAQRTCPVTGKLVYGDANIANHLFTVPFLERLASVAFPVHGARKNIPLGDGTAVAGIKQELFIFDAFAESGALAILEVSRQKEFSPVKNATGEDSPETALKDFVAAMH